MFSGGVWRHLTARAENQAAVLACHSDTFHTGCIYILRGALQQYAGGVHVAFHADSAAHLLDYKLQIYQVIDFKTSAPVSAIKSIICDVFPQMW